MCHFLKGGQVYPYDALPIYADTHTYTDATNDMISLGETKRCGYCSTTTFQYLDQRDLINSCS